jgi:hypothetical protein
MRIQADKRMADETRKTVAIESTIVDEVFVVLFDGRLYYRLMVPLLQTSDVKKAVFAA